MNIPRERAGSFVRVHLDAFLGPAVLIFTFLVFRSAPIQQAGDSRYSMLLAQNILQYHNFNLDRYKLPESDYRLLTSGGHRYYFFPPGTSLLSTPFVALMHLRGISPVGADGRYNLAGELLIDARLANLLMALFAGAIYYTARLLLPISSSLAITCVSAFGTQVFSTMSRSMWSNTWGVLLVLFAVFLLLESAAQQRPLRLTLLATCLAWAYMARPTNSIVLVATSIYILVDTRRFPWAFFVTAAAWLGLFVGFSWRHFHQPLPAYFEANRIHFPHTPLALLGNLVSPSRGLLVCVPAVMAVGLILARYWRSLRFPRLVGLALVVMVGHLLVLSGFERWWGGHGYGARLTASLVPWMAVLGIIAVDASRAQQMVPSRHTGPIYKSLVAAICIVSICINAIGAYSMETSKWNLIPEDIDRTPWRLWSWYRPQFLAPFREPDGPFLRLPASGLSLGSAEADTYLGRGWPYGEGDLRWTEEHQGSTIRFSLLAESAGDLELELRPYLVGHKLAKQRLIASMNGQDIGALILSNPNFAVYRLHVTADVARKDNYLKLYTPDAASPFDMEGAPDRRVLGVAVRKVRWYECGKLDVNGMLGGREEILSCDGRFALTMQVDGDLVLSGCRSSIGMGCACWHSGSFGHRGARLVMQDDGNLVIVGPDCTGEHNTCWSSASFGHPGAFLAVENDGNVCVRSPGCTGDSDRCWCSDTTNCQ